MNARSFWAIRSRIGVRQELTRHWLVICSVPILTRVAIALFLSIPGYQWDAWRFPGSWFKTLMKDVIVWVVGSDTVNHHTGDAIWILIPDHDYRIDLRKSVEYFVRRLSKLWLRTGLHALTTRRRPALRLTRPLNMVHDVSKFLSAVVLDLINRMTL